MFSRRFTTCSQNVELKSQDNVPLSLDNDLLSLDNDPLSQDNDLLSLDNDLLSQDNDLLSLDNDLLSLDNASLSLDNDPLSQDNDLLSLDNASLSLDNDPLSQDNDLLSLDNDLLSQDNDLLSKDNNQPSLDGTSSTRDSRTFWGNAPFVTTLMRVSSVHHRAGWLPDFRRGGKKRSAYAPFLTEAYPVSVGLKPHDPTPAPSVTPAARVTAGTYPAGRRVLGAKVSGVMGSAGETANKGCGMWYGAAVSGETPPVRPEASGKNDGQEAGYGEGGLIENSGRNGAWGTVSAAFIPQAGKGACNEKE
ncbi:MAG: hypothetical protein LBP19_07630 [Treponema sp.]|nr:hypothetical protein [Treponema sp.]